ncbi:MAG: transglycosylase SLT domain-containing protein [Rhodanobacteraceae bacterium]
MSIWFWRPARRHTLYVVALLSCCLAACGIAQATSAAPTLAQQRTAFRAAWNAAQSGKDWRPLAKDLRDYPLYPYLEAVALQHDIKTAGTAQVDAYLKRYPGWIPARRLRQAALRWLASQKDWKTFRHFYQPGLGETLTCDDLQARLAQGEPLQFSGDFAKLWHKTHLPSACTPVLKAAFVQGLLTPERVWNRIERAANAGRVDTIKQSAQWLTDDDATAAQRIAQALDAPSKLLSQAAAFPDTPHDREAIARALIRLARSNSQQALTFWQSLSKQFMLDAQQRNRVLAALALYNAVDGGPQAVQRLAALPGAAQTDATREWRVRAAVANGDWQAAETAIDALKPDESKRDEWRFWRARIAQQLGDSAAARDDYAALADETSFFGFLAADRADLPYSICPVDVPPNAVVDQQLARDPGLVRAFEFFAIDLLPQARREWNLAFASLTPDQQRHAAALATHKGWYDRAIFAFGKTGDFNYYALRFPLADKHRVLKASDSAGIDPAWTFAIIRAETAWQTDAQSGADARGLMQLLPSTAKMVARRNDLPYHGSASLYDPAINIPLGTQYLARLAARFDGNPWLATAAYNAGPRNVQRWVDARGELDPERFILSIPFNATRAYVARVLEYETIYGWRLHGKSIPVSSRMPAIGTPYDRKVDPRRKRVVCRVPTPAAKASTSASHSPAPRSIPVSATSDSP